MNIGGEVDPFLLLAQAADIGNLKKTAPEAILEIQEMKGSYFAAITEIMM